ncbi:MAG: TonB-dependent receptor [Bacteroidota bacterium]|jgi:TonB-linked SusC/RagA family outer membrane protein|uniref:TonB-linked outer membrane protein, SusC/RagA family n=7 Tax=Bacteroidales TaxID=171549 RepID=A0A1T4ZS04_9BACT|nr:TonB-dependent receptor [Parabacteroides chartae]MDT3369012.1 TonB-dependent receptor [Bacteroidota bacterium]SKB25564.1 TonB-linked outer membrane protein, SusC/RagA family [Parabacteroides chartae]HML70441.1 TonB-dependent receptor [Macellibacteroides fermentans]
MEEKCSTFSLRKLSSRLMQMVIVTAFLLVNCLPAMAQSNTKVKGVITSGADGLPLIGVNVVEKGTTNGTVTDFDGNFELTVSSNAVLDISYIGFLSQEVKIVAGKTTYNVVLKEDSQALEEVVVVGYGVQKKKLVTGATVQVSGDNLQKLSTTNALGALQSQSPGVNITQSSGQPGEGFKVVIRGLGTVGSSGPLYVIDGVAGGDINALNPSDIESIDVLKDAASAAIYGARAANGVVLVTTKQGKAGKLQLSYDGYYGAQYLAKLPPLLNAREYMSMMDETRYNEASPGYDWPNLLPTDLYNSIMDGSWQGTNWIKETYNEAAPTQNHSFNLAGGTEQSKFSMGFSYTSQEGILGKPVQSQFDRYTARINSDHVLLKVKDFDAIKIGETLNFNYNTKSGIAIGNIYGNSIHNMLIGNPLLPAYDAEGNFYDYDDKVNNGWNFDGNTGNPLAGTALSNWGLNLSKNYALQSSAYLEIQPIKNLVFRSQFGYKMTASSYRSYDGIRHLSNNTNVTMDNVYQSASSGHNITLDNTIAYKFNVADLHQFDVVVGQSVEKWGMGSNINASGNNSIFEGSFDHAWVDNTKPTELSQRGAGGSPWGEGALASFFGRANYNYKETYMASLTMRADGSSNFARGNRWGYFPSASAGWVMTNESFMEDAKSWMDFLKLRASWGQNGNASINPFQYQTTFAFDTSNGYYFDSGKKVQTVGGYADILANPDVTWETSEQLNFGLDSRFLNSRLGLTFDWYVKTTKDWLVTAPISGVWGLNPPAVNGGDIENRGFEVALNWNDKVGEFNYGATVNFAHNKNEVTRIANAEGIIHGDANVLSQGTTEMYRAQVGYPIGYFYGYKTAGVFQNWSQVDGTAAKYAGAQPGDLIFVDSNNDGKITEDDRTQIGNPHPDFTMGLNLNFSYKGFDLNITGAGAFGQQIAKSYRSFADSPLQNYTTDIFGRWTGEGTSNKLPRLTSGSHTNWQNISDIYIEDGDYLKIQNLTIGYDFKKLFPTMPLGQARLYLTAQNLFTFTGYSGMDPEIGYGYDKSWVSGIDLGYYPSPRTYMVGVNLKF